MPVREISLSCFKSVESPQPATDTTGTLAGIFGTETSGSCAFSGSSSGGDSGGSCSVVA